MQDQLRGKGAFPQGNDLDVVAEAFGDPARCAAGPFSGRFPSIAELNEPHWRASIIASLPVPFPSTIHISGTHILAKQVFVHRLIRESLVDIFTDLVNAGAWQFVTDFAGCYAYRVRRGGASLSLHSWAAALDFNAERFPLGAAPDPSDPFVKHVVPVFESRGWTWGGRWISRPDAMHFQATTGA